MNSHYYGITDTCAGVSIKFEVGSQFEKSRHGIDKGPQGSFFNYFNLGRK